MQNESGEDWTRDKTRQRRMTQSQKIWTLRLVSIPALLYLPITCIGIGITLSRENRGDSFPTVSLLSFLGGLIAAVVLSRQTLFAPIKSSPNRCLMVFAGIVLFEIAAFCMFAR